MVQLFLQSLLFLNQVFVFSVQNYFQINTCNLYIFYIYFTLYISTLFSTRFSRTFIRTETPFLVEISALCTTLLTHPMLLITRHIAPSAAPLIRTIPTNILKTFRIRVSTWILYMYFRVFNTTFNRKLLITGLHRINSVRIKFVLNNIAVLAVSFLGFQTASGNDRASRVSYERRRGMLVNSAAVEFFVGFGDFVGDGGHSF